MSRNARSRRYKLRREQFLAEVAESFRRSVGELRAATISKQRRARMRSVEGGGE